MGKGPEKQEGLARIRQALIPLAWGLLWLTALAESLSDLPCFFLSKSCLAQSRTLFPGTAPSKDWEVKKIEVLLA